MLRCGGNSEGESRGKPDMTVMVGISASLFPPVSTLGDSRLKGVPDPWAGTTLG